MIVSQALNEARLEAVVNFLSIGILAPKVALYDAADVHLADIILPEPVGGVADNVLTFTPSDEAMIATTGTASYAEVINGNGDLAWRCDVSNMSGSSPLKLSSVVLYAGGYTRLVSGSLG